MSFNNTFSLVFWFDALPVDIIILSMELCLWMVRRITRCRDLDPQPQMGPFEAQQSADQPGDKCKVTRQTDFILRCPVFSCFDLDNDLCRFSGRSWLTLFLYMWYSKVRHTYHFKEPPFSILGIGVTTQKFGKLLHYANWNIIL